MCSVSSARQIWVRCHRPELLSVPATSLPSCRRRRGILVPGILVPCQIFLPCGECYLTGMRAHTKPGIKFLLGNFRSFRAPSPFTVHRIQGEASLSPQFFTWSTLQPCLCVEGRLSWTDGKPAAVLRPAAKWDKGRGDLMGCGIDLKGHRQMHKDRQ